MDKCRKDEKNSNKSFSVDFSLSFLAYTCLTGKQNTFAININSSKAQNSTHLKKVI